VRQAAGRFLERYEALDREKQESLQRRRSEQALAETS
jgi:hypothetical protein